MMSIPDNAPQPRLCHITKWANFSGYGFNLHAEKSKPGQFIGNVDPNSPGEMAGLRKGDRIIEVNGVNICQENHKQVVKRIKAVENETRLLVVDPDTEIYYKDQDIPITGDMPNIEFMSSEIKTDNGNKPEDEVVEKMEEVKMSPPPVFHVVGEGDSNSVRSDMSATSSTDKAKVEDDPSPLPPAYKEHEEEEEEQQQQPETLPDLDQEKEAEETVEVDRDSPVDQVMTEEVSRNADIHEEEEEEEEDLPPPPSPPPQIEYLQGEDESRGGLSSEPEVEEKPFGGSTSGSSPRSTPSPEPNSIITNGGHRDYGGLNLNMTAAEMRQRIGTKKKKDPRKDDRMDFRKKHDIIQRL